MACACRGFDPYPDAVKALGTGLQAIYDPGVIDLGLSAEFSTALTDMTSLFSDAAAPLNSIDLLDDLSAALDPGVRRGVRRRRISGHRDVSEH